MKTRTRTQLVAIVAGTCLAGAAQAAVTISSVAVLPTYGTTLNFDEVGGPTGVLPPPPFQPWLPSHGLSVISGEGARAVGQVNLNPGFGWLGTGNVFFGPFGIFMTFSQPIQSLSFQYWDASGPGGPFGGGALILVGNENNPDAFLSLSNPAFGGVGNPNFNITTTGGSTFTEVRLVGFGFTPDAYMDNLSWNVPAPGAAALLGMGGLSMIRRRRA